MMPMFATLLLLFILLDKSSFSLETYEYLGCFDTMEHLQVMHNLFTYPDINGPDFCGKKCAEQGLPIFALKKEHCFCFRSDFNRDRETLDDECHEHCPDSSNGAQMCGGHTTYSVYFIRNMPGENITRPAEVQNLFATNPTTDNYYWEGKPIKIRCVAYGKPLPSLEWKTPDLILIDYAQLASPEIKSSGKMSVDKVFEAKRNMNKQPLVCAALQNDTIMDSKSQNISVFFTPQSIQVTFQTEFNRNDSCRFLAITCHVQEAKPAPLIQWKALDANKNLLNLNSFHVPIKVIQREHRGKNGGIVTTSTVRVTNFQALYKHQFLCTAFQPDGRQIQNTSSVLTELSILSAMQKIIYPQMPYFEHQKITFACKISYINADSSIQWWLHDSISGFTERIKDDSQNGLRHFKLKKQSSNLDLTVSRYYHNKLIGCFVTQNKNVYSAVTRPLIVFNLPQVIIRGVWFSKKQMRIVDSDNEKLILPQEAQDCTLQCTAEHGFPTFGYSFNWNIPPQVKLTSNGNQLHLGVLKVEYEGRYECVVHTLAGVASSNVFFQVQT